MPRQMSGSYKRTVKYYDDNFDLKEKTVEGKIVSGSTIEEAKSLLGNDDAAVLNALNTVIRQTQIDAAMQAATGGMEERFIMGFIKPMRSMAPFNVEEDEKKQTAAILSQVKQVPFLLEGLKSYCKIRSSEDPGSEGE